jgi:predicted HTH domain antitoxin
MAGHRREQNMAKALKVAPEILDATRVNFPAASGGAFAGPGTRPNAFLPAASGGVSCGGFMTEDELAREFAVFLYHEEKLPLARAKEVAGMARLAFQGLLASRGIPIRYGKRDLRADVATLRQLKRL